MSSYTSFDFLLVSVVLFSMSLRFSICVSLPPTHSQLTTETNQRPRSVRTSDEPEGLLIQLCKEENEFDRTQPKDSEC